MSVFFLTLLRHFQTQEKFINVMKAGYCLLTGTIQEGTNRQRSVREGIIQEEIIRGWQLSGWASSGGKYLSRDFFEVGNPRGRLAEGELSLWMSYLWGKCLREFVRGSICLQSFTSTSVNQGEAEQYGV